MPNCRVNWKVSDAKLRPIALDAFGDSLRAFGFGVADREDWFETVEESLHDALEAWEAVLSEDQFTVLQAALRVIPCFGRLRSWSRLEWLAVALRGEIALRTLFSGESMLPERVPYFTAAVAHSLAESRLVLHGPTSFRGLVERQFVRSGQSLRWQDGVTHIDVFASYSRNVLRAAAVSADLKVLLAVSRTGIAHPDSWHRSRELAQESVRAVYVDVQARIRERLLDCHRALGELEAASCIDHQWVTNLEINPRCIELGMSHNELRIRIGADDVLVIGPALSARLHDQKATMSFIRGEQPEDTDPGHGLGVFGGLAPLVNVRGHYVWRGTTDSARFASSVISRVVRTSVSTAWLAVRGDAGVLEYMVSLSTGPGSTPEPVGSVSSRFVVKTELETKRVGVVNIESDPPQFPISSFLQACIDGCCGSGKGPRRDWRFVIAAMRLLGDCDEMTERVPGHAFVAAMAAVEACLASKSGELSKSLARRAARLLVGERNLRPQAERLWLALYDHRSRVVHGDEIATSVADAVFMRYVASCVVYACAGLARALGRLDDASGAKAVRQALDGDECGVGLLPGVAPCDFFQRLIVRGCEFVGGDPRPSWC